MLAATWEARETKARWRSTIGLARRMQVVETKLVVVVAAVGSGKARRAACRRQRELRRVRTAEELLGWTSRRDDARQRSRSASTHPHPHPHPSPSPSPLLLLLLAAAFVAPPRCCADASSTSAPVLTISALLLHCFFTSRPEKTPTTKFACCTREIHAHSARHCATRATPGPLETTDAVSPAQPYHHHHRRRCNAATQPACPTLSRTPRSKHLLARQTSTLPTSTPLPTPARRSLPVSPGPSEAPWPPIAWRPRARSLSPRRHRTPRSFAPNPLARGNIIPQPTYKST